MRQDLRLLLENELNIDTRALAFLDRHALISTVCPACAGQLGAAVFHYVPLGAQCDWHLVLQQPGALQPCALMRTGCGSSTADSMDVDVASLDCGNGFQSATVSLPAHTTYPICALPAPLGMWRTASQRASAVQQQSAAILYHGQCSCCQQRGPLLIHWVRPRATERLPA
jgi:hypothetical protein